MTKVGANLKVEGWNDREEFSKVAAAMRILNFKENEYSRIFELLAALLHYRKGVYFLTDVLKFQSSFPFMARRLT